jgi:hypothetical protein
MSLRQRKLASLCGLLGSVILIIGCIVPALSFHGKDGETYSLLNYFISELGLVGVSKLANVFNGCLIVSSLSIGMFMVGLGRHFQTRLACAGAVSGMVFAMLGSVVGQIPMNDLEIHLKMAFCYFLSGLFTIGLFSLVMARDRNNRLPRRLLIPSLIAMASFAALLAWPLITRQSLADIIRVYHTSRPGIWVLAILEWLVFIMGTTWIILVSACLWMRGGPQTEN